MDPTSPAVVVGVVADRSATPTAAGQDPEKVARELAAALAQAQPVCHWEVRAVPPLPEPAPAAAVREVTEVLSRGRRVLLAEDLDVVVVLTPDALTLHGRPVTAHVSPVQQAVVLSVPTVGVHAHRAGSVAAGLVVSLLETEDPGEASRRVMHELASTVSQDSEGMAFVADTVRGSVRLLLGMIRANRPWLLTVRLSKTLVGAFAAAFVSIVTPDVWTLADRMAPLRLALIAVLVLLGTCGVLVIGGGLRERAPSRRVRRTVLIHNIAVWVSVGLGVLALYLGLVVSSLAVTLLVLPWGLVAHTVGHPVDLATMLRIGGLASVVALVGSAFGAGLEDDATVQQATYAGSDDAQYADRDADSDTGRDADSDAGRAEEPEGSGTSAR